MRRQAWGPETRAISFWPIQLLIGSNIYIYICFIYQSFILYDLYNCVQHFKLLPEWKTNKITN